VEHKKIWPHFSAPLSLVGVLPPTHGDLEESIDRY
jgi:hypothetical protein